MNSASDFDDINSIGRDSSLKEPEFDEENFKRHFTITQLEKKSIVELAQNLNLIYMILVGLTDLFRIYRDEHEKTQESYYKIDENNDPCCNNFNAWKNETRVHEVLAKDFLRDYPDLAVNDAGSIQDSVKLTEFAPKIFRKIRQNIISEKAMYESMIPIANFASIHNF